MGHNNNDFWWNKNPAVHNLSASALGVFPQAQGDILVVKSRDESLVEGGSVGSGGHEGHEGGLAGVVGSGVTGGKGACVLLQAVVLLIELLEHFEDDAEVDICVGNVDFVGAIDVTLSTDSDECTGGDGTDGSGNSTDNGSGTRSEDGSGGDGGGDGEGSYDGLLDKKQIEL